MVIEWLGLLLGVKFPLVPKIQAWQKCQFCDQLSIYGTSDAKEVQVGQANKGSIITPTKVLAHWLSSMQQ